MKYLISITLALLLLKPTTTPTIADTVRKKCDSVHRFAEIEFDSKLILSVVKDGDNNTCTFYVSLPPPESSNSLGEATKLFNALRYAGDQSSAIYDIEYKFVPSVMEALAAPLDDPRFDSMEWTSLNKVVFNEQKAIYDCSVNAILTNMKYERINKNISCGLSNNGIYFTIEAADGSRSVAISMPIYR